MESVRGQLLIAGPQLEDPNFWRTVILVVEHDGGGALGLVLNRPSASTVAEVVPALEAFVDGDRDVFVGGPVEPASMVVLADFDEPADAAILAFDRVGVLGADTEFEPLAGRLGDIRVFAGYAGWGPGQLDAELERGDWFTDPAGHADAFATDPERLWTDVLARKGGSYALLARMPADPSSN